MASSRYSASTTLSSVVLPSLKDLNFPYRGPGRPADAAAQEVASNQPRSVNQWGSRSQQQQQPSPPLSTHEQQYPPAKQHDQPAYPTTTTTTSAPIAVQLPGALRREAKRPRTSARPPQSQPQASASTSPTTYTPYPPFPQPTAAYQGQYSGYQQQASQPQFIHPREVQQPPPPSHNPYPSPGPGPPSAQGQWERRQQQQPFQPQQPPQPQTQPRYPSSQSNGHYPPPAATTSTPPQHPQHYAPHSAHSIPHEQQPTPQHLVRQHSARQAPQARVQPATAHAQLQTINPSQIQHAPPSSQSPVQAGHVQQQPHHLSHPPPSQPHPSLAHPHAHSQPPPQLQRPQSQSQRPPQAQQQHQPARSNSTQSHPPPPLNSLSLSHPQPPHPHAHSITPPVPQSHSLPHSQTQPPAVIQLQSPSQPPPQHADPRQLLRNPPPAPAASSSTRRAPAPTPPQAPPQATPQPPSQPTFMGRTVPIVPTTVERLSQQAQQSQHAPSGSQSSPRAHQRQPHNDSSGIYGGAGVGITPQQTQKTRPPPQAQPPQQRRPPQEQPNPPPSTTFEHQQAYQHPPPPLQLHQQHSGPQNTNPHVQSQQHAQTQPQYQSPAPQQHQPRGTPIQLVQHQTLPETPPASSSSSGYLGHGGSYSAPLHSANFGAADAGAGASGLNGRSESSPYSADFTAPPTTARSDPMPSAAPGTSYQRSEPQQVLLQAQAPTQAQVQAGYTSPRGVVMNEILEHCRMLYAFASRYASTQQSQNPRQPHMDEIAEMAQRANEVVRLLGELKRMDHLATKGPGAGIGIATSMVGIVPTVIATPPVQHRAASPTPTPMEVDVVPVVDLGASGGSLSARAPKRPWESMEGDGDEVDELDDSEEAPYPTPPGANGPTTAEQDMELIRVKRAATSGNGANGVVTKTKYRKRSRTTPPGKCHSCQINETPEWRRGPDGARTLCNACGLHYAKLLRKRDKEAANGGNPPAKIDMETLRASARADQSHKEARKQQAAGAAVHQTSAPAKQAKHQSTEEDVEMEVVVNNKTASPSRTPNPPPPAPQSAHESTFQLQLSTSLSPATMPRGSTSTWVASQPQPPPPPVTASATPIINGSGTGSGSVGANSSASANTNGQRTFIQEQLHPSFTRAAQASPSSR
ncbi:GATA-type domain-containing protein [Mycena kentingensis (nom. inval.)]|nr:GATA-type domain-containing protein [Mycena kentingensis (nom. inval.)]